MSLPTKPILYNGFKIKEGLTIKNRIEKVNLANHLVENVFADVAHRQYVFTIPKRFRLYFRYNRALLSELARCAWRAVRDVYGFVLGNAAQAGV